MYLLGYYYVRQLSKLCPHAVFVLVAWLNFDVMGPLAQYSCARYFSFGTCRTVGLEPSAVGDTVSLYGYLTTRLAIPTQDCSVRVWDRRQAHGCCGCHWLGAPALSLSSDPCSKVLLAVGTYAKRVLRYKDYKTSMPPFRVSCEVRCRAFFSEKTT